MKNKTLQSPVFLQLYIQKDRIDDLKKLLEQGGNPMFDQEVFPLNQIENVHFARWIIAPATDKFKASVIYSANVDGTVKDHLNQLVEKLLSCLIEILQVTDGFVKENMNTKGKVLDFLLIHNKKTPAFYVGAPGKSVQDIKREDETVVVQMT